MSRLKQYRDEDVLSAARRRIVYAFDHFERVYVSFSGGKDSTTLLHLVMDEAIARDRRVGVLVIDLEAQYQATITHIWRMLDTYAKHIDAHVVCLPIKLRNAVSNYEPVWCCWDPAARHAWVRDMPNDPRVVSDPKAYPWFSPHMEFEEFIVHWGEWYAQGIETGAFIGIRADESLNRFRTIAARFKAMHGSARFTTKVTDQCYNVYPMYDWRSEDVWRYHARYPDRRYNPVYDQMHKAGVPMGHMRLCQPYGDDQRRGLWLYHILEPHTWSRIVARVSGANSGALYVQETGNVTGYQKISRPDGHTWESFTKLLLASLPNVTRRHYAPRFRVFTEGWRRRGYYDGIPDEAPRVLEEQHWAPSWRRLCKVLLRNDWWCKGLGLTQPASESYKAFRALKKTGVYSS